MVYHTICKGKEILLNIINEKVGGFVKNKIKVLFVGGPCSGKTTLCKSLSEKYKTIFIEEYLMNYMIKNNLKSEEVTKDIILYCMEEQANQENEIILNKQSIQFCEGTSLSGISTLYSEELINIIKIQLKDCKLVFLCNNDIPYINTDVRPNHEIALNCHKAIIKYLKDNNINYILLSGSLEERISKVEKEIDKIKNKGE